MTKELSAKDIKNLSTAELFMPAPEACHLLVACRRDDYAASRIARAVEDVDAHILNLNLLSPRRADDEADTPADCILVGLRVGRRDASAVVRSLARYGYEVVDFDGPAVTGYDDDTARTRAEALLRYLEM